MKEIKLYKTLKRNLVQRTKFMKFTWFFGTWTELSSSFSWIFIVKNWTNGPFLKQINLRNERSSFGKELLQPWQNQPYQAVTLSKSTLPCNCISGVRLIRFNVKATEAKPTTDYSVEIKESQEYNGTNSEHHLDVSLSGKTGWMGYDDEFWMMQS